MKRKGRKALARDDAWLRAQHAARRERFHAMMERAPAAKPRPQVEPDPQPRGWLQVLRRALRLA